jgi:uncharacterized protein (UPF0262 family)
MSDQKIVNITLDERTVLRRNADVEHERAVAIFDLLEENSFAPKGNYPGPFHVRLGIEENRLLLEVCDTTDGMLEKITLPLQPFRGIVRDYFLVCESYFNAIRRASPSQIEAIDMGRRALHNEGATMLRERLADRVEIDDNTARRLFTLVCVLHIR